MRLYLTVENVFQTEKQNRQMQNSKVAAASSCLQVSNLTASA